MTLNRHRVGVLLPSKSIYLEPFLYKAAPAQFSFHFTRLLLRETTPEALGEMALGIEEAARLIQEVDPDVILFACASGSFVKGRDADQEIKSRIEKITGVPVLVASMAMTKALHHLKIRRVALATPYIDEVTSLETEFLEKNGFTVVSAKGLGLSGARIRDQEPDTLSRLIQEVDHPEAEGIFVSCANLRVHDILDGMERLVSKPVLSTNPTLLWNLLVTANCRVPIRGFGRLLEDL